MIEERLDHARVLHGFSLNVLAWAIQNALDPKCIERWLQTFNGSVMKYSLKIPVLGGSIVPSLPILYFAVERNSPEIVRILCKAGADPNATAQPSGLPVLLYAVLSAEYGLSDTTETVIAHLAMGANPEGVPKDM